MNYTLLWKPRKLAASLRNKLTHKAGIRQAIKFSEQRFASDPNYRLDLVQEGFAPRPGVQQDDSVILKRIIAAYKKSKIDQHSAAEAFNVSNEWLPIYERRLGAVMNALLSENIGDLQRMYQNFFRDPCSFGLVGLPVDMQKNFFRGRISTKYKKYALADVLHRYELWKKRTRNAYPTTVLASPLVGNPFGYSMDGVFVRSGGDYHHYYSHAIKHLVEPKSSKTVVELGGGFGGLAYFLGRDIPGITYIDFDLPEAIALASYYLMKALPDHSITLYGEGDLTDASFTRPGIFMLPSFEIMKMPAKSIDVSFNSYSLAEMSPATIRLYIQQIARITRGYFLHINHNKNAVLTADNFGVEGHGFNLVSREIAGWTLGINPDSDEFEYLYIDGSGPH
ncbi:MAG: putative sugar O-methyltransferase [Acidobacteriota bacterium]|nr:putative sugar O-methyltransferase [Acidobacteriota bacterium]